MTTLNDLADAADLSEAREFAMPFHYGPDAVLPCFACFVETMMQTLATSYAGRSVEDYQAAMDGAIGQIADCLGALIYQLASDPDHALERFVKRTEDAMDWIDGLDAAAMVPAHQHH